MLIFSAFTNIALPFIKSILQNAAVKKNKTSEIKALGYRFPEKKNLLSLNLPGN